MLANYCHQLFLATIAATGTIATIAAIGTIAKFDIASTATIAEIWSVDDRLHQTFGHIEPLSG